MFTHVCLEPGLENTKVDASERQEFSVLEGQDWISWLTKCFHLFLLRTIYPHADLYIVNSFSSSNQTTFLTHS